jgi:hypothetical protein
VDLPSGAGYGPEVGLAKHDNGRSGSVQSERFLN